MALAQHAGSFRGMIHNMLGNKFYVGAYKDEMVWRTKKFMDTSQGPVALGCSLDMQIWQRRLLYCIPGLFSRHANLATPMLMSARIQRSLEEAPVSIYQGLIFAPGQPRSLK